MKTFITGLSGRHLTCDHIRRCYLGMGFEAETEVIKCTTYVGIRQLLRMQQSQQKLV